MSTTGRTDAEAGEAESAVATAIREASLVRFIVTTDGDALAAAGLLATACGERSIPYHLGVARSRAQIEDQIAQADDETTTVVLGADHPVTVGLSHHSAAEPSIEPASVAVSAYQVATELATDPDPVTALAGAVASGAPPDGPQSAVAFRTATDQGMDRRPGIAVPVDDLADGLAHSTLFHGEFSGDVEATTELLGPLADRASYSTDDRRAIASLVAMAVTDTATDRATGALQRALNPFQIDHVFRTLGGYADVLSALADRAPGRGLTTILGTPQGDGNDALEIWRAHARAVHRGIREAETSRYSGLFVASVTEAPVLSVARLLRDFRSPEPTVLVQDTETGHVAIVGTDSTVGATLAEALEGRAIDRGTYGYAAVDVRDALSGDDLATRIREGLE